MADVSIFLVSCYFRKSSKTEQIYFLNYAKHLGCIAAICFEAICLKNTTEI